jgi:hypothetical protein
MAGEDAKEKCVFEMEMRVYFGQNGVMNVVYD